MLPLISQRLLDSPYNISALHTNTNVSMKLTYHLDAFIIIDSGLLFSNLNLQQCCACVILFLTEDTYSLRSILEIRRRSSQFFNISVSSPLAHIFVIFSSRVVVSLQLSNDIHRGGSSLSSTLKLKLQMISSGKAILDCTILHHPSSRARVTLLLFDDFCRATLPFLLGFMKKNRINYAQKQISLVFLFSTS